MASRLLIALACTATALKSAPPRPLRATRPPTALRTATALSRPQTAPLRPPTALGATRQATLGLGCFWAPSEELLGVEGVVDTRCGYAGAVFPDARPSYASVCGGDGNV